MCIYIYALINPYTSEYVHIFLNILDEHRVPYMYNIYGIYISPDCGSFKYISIYVYIYIYIYRYIYIYINTFGWPTFYSTATSEAGRGTNIFVDCSKSMGFIEWSPGTATCITPSHQIYSCELERYLEPAELLVNQGIWRDDFVHPDVFENMVHANPNLAHSFAGNAFTSTMCQGGIFGQSSGVSVMESA